MTDGRLLDRWGEAVVAPRRAMARAEAATVSGRPGIDLAWAVVIAVLAAHTRTLVAAVWIGLEFGPRAAVAPMVAVLTAAATVPLVAVAIGTLVVWLAAGARRELGRDADLGCVVALAPALAAIATSTVARLVPMPAALALALVAAAGVWPLVVAVGAARRRAVAP
ncbi:MAG: hypothetical protein IPL61_03460 [Myxococcales bacterium]|nr:hypothetical protein [Myxococcales bacterium]